MSVLSLSHSCAKCFLFILLILTGGAAIAQDSTDECMKCSCDNPMGYAPAGIMFGHVHSKGEWMFSYRFMQMQMDGNTMNGLPVSDEQVYLNYLMSPAAMQMNMHMLMAMYSFSDKLSAMLMLNYNQVSMDMNMMPVEGMDMPGMQMPGHASSMYMQTHGLGDTKIYLAYSLFHRRKQLVVLAGGLSVPTGKVTLQSPSYSGETTERASYNMQMGSGTVDLLPVISYTGEYGRWHWGAEASATIRTYNNPAGYRLGNTASISPWIAYQPLSWLGNSIRLEGITSAPVQGYDNAIYQYREPNADPANYGGNLLAAQLGTNFYIKHGPLKNSKLVFEYGLPVYHKMNGIQMNLHYVLYAGWQYSF